MNLSKRDRLAIIMSALHLLDDVEPGRRIDLNLSGVMVASENVGYIEELCCSDMPGWSDEQIKAFIVEEVAKL